MQTPGYRLQALSQSGGVASASEAPTISLPSAFLSSIISVSDWVLRLLPAWAQLQSDLSHDAELDRWHAMGRSQSTLWELSAAHKAVM